MAIKHVSIRIDEQPLQRLQAVAAYQGRSVNSQINWLIRKSIESCRHVIQEETLRSDSHRKKE